MGSAGNGAGLEAGVADGVGHAKAAGNPGSANGTDAVGNAKAAGSVNAADGAGNAEAVGNAETPGKATAANAVNGSGNTDRVDSPDGDDNPGNPGNPDSAGNTDGDDNPDAVDAASAVSRAVAEGPDVDEADDAIAPDVTAAGIADGASAAGEDAGVDPSEVVLELRHATKAFGAAQALADGSVVLRAGEAHALLGENGAGKSTLVKILAGVHQPDSGELLVAGEAITLHGPAAAKAAGIAVIYQEPMLFPDLTVAENIFMGRQPVRSGRRIDRGAMNRAATEIFAQLGVALDPARPARGLSVADQQIVEIAKALSLNARVLIMDEPTAALTNVEVERLFKVMATLRQRGAALMFISHRLEEVFASCQRVTIMRDGRFVLTAPTSELDVDAIIRSMIGRDLHAMYQKTRTTPGDVVLDVEGLTRDKVFYDVSFQVRRGEIVALAGLVGAGRTEVARAVFGIDRRTSGTVLMGGKPLPNGEPTAAMAAGIAFVPEDRRQQGLVMDMSIENNMALASLARLSKGGLIFGSSERRLTTTWAKNLQLKYRWTRDAAWTLSGGNQQKVVLGKWLARQPVLLIIDEPTRGIDVGTKAEVHRILDELAAEGMAVLMISSELPEVLGVADRILVLHEGKLTAEIARADASEDVIMRAATGQNGQNGKNAKNGQNGQNGTQDGKDAA